MITLANESWHPTPGFGPAVFPTLPTRSGCTLRYAVTILQSHFKHMKTSVMIALCSVGIVVSGCSKSPTADSVTLQKPDSEVLHGIWNGQEVGAESQGSPSLTFEGTKLEFHGANTQEWYKATFTLREDTTPKQLEAVVTECPAPQYVGKTAHAIYKIEGGKLTLTGNEPGNPAVPASFNAPGARQLVFTLKQ